MLHHAKLMLDSAEKLQAELSEYARRVRVDFQERVSTGKSVTFDDVLDYDLGACRQQVAWSPFAQPTGR